MTKPIRIQLHRTRGWRMPPNTVSVARPSRWGNPYFPACGLGFGNIDADGNPHPWPLRNNTDCVRHFREYVRLMKRDEPERFEIYIGPLRGKNLACFCKPGEPCHADVLLELACEPVEAANG